MKHYVRAIILNEVLLKEIPGRAVLIEEVRGAACNLDSWLQNNIDIFYNEKKQFNQEKFDLFRQTLVDNIYPRNPEIDQKNIDFGDQLWENTTLKIRLALSKIIENIETDKKKNENIGVFIHSIKNNIRVALIKEGDEYIKQQQQSESSWKDKKNITNNTNKIPNILSEQTSKPKKSVSWAKTVQKIQIPKENDKTPN
jgi:hypothetical protein